MFVGRSGHVSLLGFIPEQKASGRIYHKYYSTTSGDIAAVRTGSGSPWLHAGTCGSPPTVGPQSQTFRVVLRLSSCCILQLPACLCHKGDGYFCTSHRFVFFFGTNKLNDVRSRGAEVAYGPALWSLRGPNAHMRRSELYVAGGP